MEHGEAVGQREQTASRLALRQVMFRLDAPRKRLALHTFFENVRLAQAADFLEQPEEIALCLVHATASLVLVLSYSL